MADARHHSAHAGSHARASSQNASREMRLTELGLAVAYVSLSLLFAWARRETRIGDVVMLGQPPFSLCLSVALVACMLAAFSEVLSRSGDAIDSFLESSAGHGWLW